MPRDFCLDHIVRAEPDDDIDYTFMRSITWPWSCDDRKDASLFGKPVLDAPQWERTYREMRPA